MFNQPSNCKGDSFFASVKSAHKAKELGHAFVGAVKNCHALFPKDGISKLMADMPGGTYVVFECEELGLIAIGYKYNNNKVLHFIMTKDAGSTVPGPVYQVRYNDKFGNTQTRDVLRPQVVSEYFQVANIIDVANQMRQEELGLEELWETRNCWFRLDTTIIGMVAVDAFHGLKFGLPDSHSLKKVLNMRRFTALLSKQFLTKAYLCSNDVNAGDNNPMPRSAAV